jgi:hypothetical protein
MVLVALNELPELSKMLKNQRNGPAINAVLGVCRQYHIIQLTQIFRATAMLIRCDINPGL